MQISNLVTFANRVYILEMINIKTIRKILLFLVLYIKILMPLSI